MLDGHRVVMVVGRMNSVLAQGSRATPSAADAPYQRPNAAAEPGTDRPKAGTST